MKMGNTPNALLELIRANDERIVAWCDGMEAGADGQPITANPYSQQTELALDWLDGHAEGQGTIPESTRPVDL